MRETDAQQLAGAIPVLNRDKEMRQREKKNGSRQCQSTDTLPPPLNGEKQLVELRARWTMDACLGIRDGGIHMWAEWDGQASAGADESFHPLLAMHGGRDGLFDKKIRASTGRSSQAARNAKLVEFP